MSKDTFSIKSELWKKIGNRLCLPNLHVDIIEQNAIIDLLNRGGIEFSTCKSDTEKLLLFSDRLEWLYKIYLKGLSYLRKLDTMLGKIYMSSQTNGVVIVKGVNSGIFRNDLNLCSKLFNRLDYSKVILYNNIIDNNSYKKLIVLFSNLNDNNQLLTCSSIFTEIGLDIEDYEIDGIGEIHRGFESWHSVNCLEPIPENVIWEKFDLVIGCVAKRLSDITEKQFC